MELIVPLGWAGRHWDRYRVIPDHSPEAIPAALPESVAPSARTVQNADSVVASGTVDHGNALMLALQNGEGAALRRLFDLYNGKLYSFAARIVGSELIAEDVVQETWVTLYEHRMSYQPTFRFSTWLFTIARRKALSELRRRKVRSVVKSMTIRKPGDEPRQMDPPQATYCGPDASADGSLVAAIIERALSRLTPLQRETVLLRDVEGFDNEEVAGILGWNVKPGALRKRIFDAREAFRKAMIAEGYEG